MRRLILATSAILALAGCNGGEDFSGATVPGCPIGTQCRENPQGDVLVELVGPRVANIGFECGSSLGFTSGSETIVGDTTVPAFNAVCPPEARSIEFFIGSGRFEGNKISLGSYLLPQQLQKGSYQVTMADLTTPPQRDSIEIVSGDTNAVINRSALVSALNVDGVGDVTLPDAANDFADQSPQFYPDIFFDYTNYADFVDAWESDFVPGVNALSQSNSEGSVAGFEPDTSAYESGLQEGNNRLRAGFYAFESAGECLIFQGCQFQNGEGARITLALRALVLPDGSVLSGGAASVVKSSDSAEDFIGFNGNAVLSDTLELQDKTAPSQGVALKGALIDGVAMTDATVSGKVLGQTIYAGVEIDGNGDFGLDYPGATYDLKDSEKGLVDGQLIGEDASGDKAVPLRATKTGAVQAVPDTSFFSTLANGGTYTVRLMRACIGENDDDVSTPDTVCNDIPSPDQEVGEGSAFNYPVSISGAANNTFAVTRERIREDINGNAEFCISIDADGIISTGATPGCNTYPVGLVSRTFTASGGGSSSANLTIRLAPGIENRNSVAHFNTEIQGRVDLGDADDCRPLYRLSDESFEAKTRSLWTEAVYERAREVANLTESEKSDPIIIRRLTSIQAGAVQFFQGAPGDVPCDPMTPPAP